MSMTDPNNIAAPRFSPEELARDEAIIQAARSWMSDHHVRRGTPEWGVLLRHAGGTEDALADWDGHSLWMMLTTMVRPRNPFRTACPTWCALERQGLPHADDFDVETGHPVTAHQGVVLEAADGEFSATLTRDDELVDGRVESRLSVTVCSELVSMGSRQLREAARALLEAADLFDDVTGGR